MEFDHRIYFDSVRESLFGGDLTQQQVDGQEAILNRFETLAPAHADIRHLAYALATTFHETASTMWPIEEYGKGAGHPYGAPDPETGQTYYGRGFVQLTWRDNYERATLELRLTGDDDLVWNADRALDKVIATKVMFRGMSQAWFRPPHALVTYFNEIDDDPVGARNIINADVSTMGKQIAGYHDKFLTALDAAII